MRSPRDMIQTILQGVAPPAGAQGPYMPPYASTLSDTQVAQLVAYLQTRHGTVRWDDLEKEVARARKEGKP